MKFFLSRHDWQLSRQALPLLVEARWRLWRTPFATLHAQWRAQVQTEIDAAALRGWAHSPDELPDRAGIDQAWGCAHAVARMAHLVPLASCLTQAMALQLLLARHGHHCSVCIGIERRKTSSTGAQLGAQKDLDAPAGDASAGDASAGDVGAGDMGAGDVGARDMGAVSDGKFGAHAWVEWRGRVLIGGDVRRWKPLTIFAPVAAPSTSTPAQ